MYYFGIKPSVYYIFPVFLSPCLFFVTCLDSGLIQNQLSKDNIQLLYLILLTLPPLLFRNYSELILTTVFTLVISVLCIYILYQQNDFLYFVDDQNHGLTFHIIIFSLLLFFSHSILYFTKKRLVHTFQATNQNHIQKNKDVV